MEDLTTEKKSNPTKYFIIALAVIAIDQTAKLLVQKYMYLHQEITLLGYADGKYGFKLHYLLNPGMAFGIKWESEFGKLALTGFRIIAMFGIAYYLIRATRKKIHTGFLVSLALILGGAVGNVIDSTFYGVWFNNQPFEARTPWFHGQVIDMLFFPLFDFVWPDWVPYVGGEEFLFFSPVFNVADSSIFLGVVTILIYQKKFFPEAHKQADVHPAAEHVVSPSSPESIPMTPPQMDGITNIEFIGAYSVEGNPDVCLIEIKILETPSKVNFRSITQEIDDLLSGSWQTPYMEKFLDELGESVIGDDQNLPTDFGSSRVIFFFHFLDIRKPFKSAHGDFSVDSISAMPNRLASLVVYKTPD